MAAKTQRQQAKKKLWVRALCLFLCLLLVFSLIAALFGIF